MALIGINLGLCTHDSSASYTIQRYLLMLLVAAETVSRTCIATIIYLVANVSISSNLIWFISGMGHHAVLL